MTYKTVGSQNHIHKFDLTDFKGRVFFTTDVHGCYDLLHEKMREYGFNSESDLLFSGGDWCDRGADSKYVLDYLTEPWVHSVQANHEDLFIGAYEEDFCGRYTNCILANGGEWIKGLTKIEAKLIYETFKAMPLGIELLLPNKQRIGIAHATVPYKDWDQFKNITKAELKWDGKNRVQWCREQYDSKSDLVIKNIDWVLHGHSPTQSGKIERFGNRIYCDLGSFFRDDLCFMEITNGIT